ncbi:MAG: PEP-utilizing enzyme [Actinomycetota bacterium]|jgi:phosphohistidine swiveling domain-containing protein
MPDTAAPLGVKWGTEELTEVPRAFHNAVREHVARRVAELGGDWKSLVFERQFDLLSRDDVIAIERDFLETGRKFQFSAEISLREEPDKYMRPEAAAPEAEGLGVVADGRKVVALGDNVARHSANVTGTIAFVSSPEQVVDYLTDGVPEGTVAVIDDSGGTLTAPILEGFKAVICLGGTVRSHLGILTREYGIPCLMNAVISDLHDGDEVEIEATAPVPTAEEYEAGRAVRAKVWKKA